MEYYSAIKRNEIRSFVEMWMDLEIVIQSKISQKTNIIYECMYLESTKWDLGPKPLGHPLITGLWPVMNWAALQEVSSWWAREASAVLTAAPCCLQYHLSPASCQISGGMINVMYLNHPKTILALSVKKTVFHNLVTGAKKVGDSWCRWSYLQNRNRDTDVENKWG